MTMADNLLDLMTGGDHRKTKRILDERKKQQIVLEDNIKKPTYQSQQSSACQPLVNSQGNSGNSNSTTANCQIKSAPIQIDQLKSLSELGIDTKFIDYYRKYLLLLYIISNILFIFNLFCRRTKCISRQIRSSRWPTGTFTKYTKSTTQCTSSTTSFTNIPSIATRNSIG